MTYKNQLHPWCIIEPMPNLQRKVVARFRRRSDAEAHLQAMRRLLPSATYLIVFDVQMEPQDSMLEQK